MTQNETKKKNKTITLLFLLLQLKVDARLLVVRNIDVANGVTNGTRAFLRSFGNKNKFLIVEIASSGQQVFITKIKQKITLRNGKVFYRVQFPVILGYAMTVHRVQGMTLSHVFMSMEDYFAFGQVRIKIFAVVIMINVNVIFITIVIVLSPINIF